MNDNDEARGRAAFLTAIRDVVLDFETEHEGRPVSVRYRIAQVALFDALVGTYTEPLQAPALATLNAYADILVALVVGGRKVPMGRAALTLEGVLVFGAIAAQISAHAVEWMRAEEEAQGPYYQKVLQALRKGHR